MGLSLDPFFGGSSTTTTASNPTSQESANNFSNLFSSTVGGLFGLGNSWINGNTAVKVADAQTNANAATLQTTSSYVKWTIVAAVALVGIGAVVMLSRRGK